MCGRRLAARWPSRDPKSELGFETLWNLKSTSYRKDIYTSQPSGFNLYCLLDNQAISGIDILGLDKSVLEHLYIYRDSSVSVGFDPLKDITGTFKVLKTIYDAIDSLNGLIGDETGRHEVYITVPDNYVSSKEVTYHFQSPSWGVNYPSGWPNGMSLLNIDIVVHFYLDYHYMWHCPQRNICTGVRCY